MLITSRRSEDDESQSEKKNKDRNHSGAYFLKMIILRRLEPRS
jgi:hypothetical protein